MSSKEFADSSKKETSVAMPQPDTDKLPPVVRRIQQSRKDGDHSNDHSSSTLPVCVIVVGMAGSGKTTLMTQLQRSLDDMDEERYNNNKQMAEAEKKKVASQTSSSSSAQQDGQKDNTVDEIDRKAKAATEIDSEQVDDEEDHIEPSYYLVNLDPATLDVTYDVSIDIRDTVNYKQVMQQHQLGPNGAIMTCLNLFCTKFDQVMTLLEKRAYGEDETKGRDDTNKIDEKSNSGDIGDNESLDYILVDTPGQIEAFTWSASGQIISESLASAFPTVLCFVVDTVRCAASPNTFMSNMLYACSMLYRTRLPIVICFNKIDVVSHEFCLEWMRDYDAFQTALDDAASTSGFYGSLTRSLSLVLDEFYTSFTHAVGVSAVTGDGMADFWATVQRAAQQDFCVDYVQDLQNRLDEKQAQERAVARNTAQRLQADLPQQASEEA